MDSNSLELEKSEHVQALEEQIRKLKVHEKMEQVTTDGTLAEKLEEEQKLRIDEKNKEPIDDGAQVKEQEQEQTLEIDEKNEEPTADGAQVKEQEQEQNLEIDEKNEKPIADGAQVMELEQEQEQTLKIDEKNEEPTAEGSEVKEQEKNLKIDETSEKRIADGAQAKEGQEQELKIHEKPFLVKGILQTVHTEFKLDIHKSEIPDAGSGLFAAGEIPTGSTIFTSDPIIACRHPELKDVCDFCFMQGDSGVHPSGRFKNAEDPHIEMKRCSGCGVAQYCSPACQAKAWKFHHKLECPILKKRGALPATVHALLRLFLLNKADKLAGPLTLNVLQELETHFTEHNSMADRAEGLLMAAQLVTAEIPAYAEHLGVVWRMYTTLLTNGANIAYAENDLSVGYMMNLGVAMLNHKCNPNAFVFTDGLKVILRSLRPIADGEEICVSYVDETLSVLRRQEELQNKFIYNCHCKKCRREHQEMQNLVPEYFNHGEVVEAMQKLLTAQKQLEDYITISFTDFHKLDKPGKNVVTGYANKIQQITKATFKDLKSDWPGTLAPLPMIRMALCNMHRNAQQLIPALRYALRGALVPRRRLGPAWVRDLFELTLVLMAISNFPYHEAFFGNDVFPTCQQIRIVVTGYIHRLAIDAVQTFGEDVAYVKALVARKAELPKDMPKPADFKDLFADAQGRLINWAGEIDQKHAVVLPAKLVLDNNGTA